MVECSIVVWLVRLRVVDLQRFLMFKVVVGGMDMW